MLKISLAVAIGAATLIGSGVAMATDPAHSAPNESGSVYHGAEYAKIDGGLARVDAWNMRAAAPTAPKVDDNWEYLGGESGAQLRQHRFDFVKGRLVHTDKIAHNTPKPSFDPKRTDLPPHTDSGA